MGCTISGLQDLDTITSRLRYLAQHHPRKELFVFYNGDSRVAFSAARLVLLAGRCARHLRDAGFQVGDVIANTLPNSPERLILDVGMMFAGCVSANLQVLLADGSDFDHFAKQSQCRGLITRPDGGGRGGGGGLWSLIKGDATRRADAVFGTTDIGDIYSLNSPRAPSIKTVILVQRFDGEYIYIYTLWSHRAKKQRLGDRNLRTIIDNLEAGDEEPLYAPAKPEDIAAILATSGSTGYSKLVPYTQGACLRLWEGVVTSLDTSTPLDVIGEGALYNDRPIGWMGGFPFHTYAYGTKRILVDLWTDNHVNKTPEFMWGVVKKEKCTVALFLMAEIAALEQHAQSVKCDYKTCLLGTGGQPIQKHSIEPIFSLTEDMVCIYGSTEGKIISAGTITADQMKDIGNFYCGKPCPYYKVKVVDEQGEECPSGKVGTIHISGEFLPSGYYNQVTDCQHQHKFAPDGWFNTDDSGYLDDQGNIYVIGRQHDVIHWGALCVYPGWLEQRILDHPAVDQVFCVPVSDPVKFQEICACVMFVAGQEMKEEELIAYCDTIFLSDAHKGMVPTIKYCLTMNELPRTATGKVCRRSLTKMAEEVFHQS